MSSVKMIALLAVLALPGCCKRYEDGPGLSLRTKTGRISNRWKVGAFYLNGTDQTKWFLDSYPGYREYYTKDHAFSRSEAGVTETGTWDFFDYKDEVRVITPRLTTEIVLLRLKENELWYYCRKGADTQEFHLVPE
jgi:hypothetical protein